MKFFCRYAGIETYQPWNRPDDYKIREWYNSLDTNLDLYIAGNVVEKHSKTWDVDILVCNPQPPLDVLSETFIECVRKGFQHKLLIDIAYVSEWYSKEWKPFYKIRPDKEFYKEYYGGVHHQIYKADEVKQLAPQLWRYDYHTPNKNYYKGLNRGYTFNRIKLENF